MTERKFEILVVDDDVGLASNLQDVLEAEGYIAAVAYDGQAALARCGEKAFDLAIVDVKLPDSSGMALVDALARQSPGIWYIVITGHASTETAIEAVGEKSIVAYETKPLNIEHLMALVRQVAERRKAEEELRESEEKLRLMFESVTEGITISGLDGNIVESNEAVVRMHGYDSKEEFIGRSAFELIGEKDHRRAVDNLKKTLERGHSGTIEYALLRKDGSEFPGELSAALMRDVSGSPAGFVAITKDISERKRTEEERKELERKAYVSSRLASIGEMASGIAHEINNPLTAVIGFAQLLMERKDVPDDIRKALETVHSGSVRVADIVRRLLTFARQDRAEREYVKISDIIENTLALRAYAMKTGNIEIRTYLDPDLPRTMAAGGQLQQVFLNIIINAETEMKGAHGKGSLLIKTEVAGETIRVSFEDDGPGITPENMDRLFEPFFTTKEPGEGTGLGLSICHGIITEHGGRLYARSELGQGATFIVELPVVAVERQVELAEAAVEEGEKVTGAKILVVDDELGIRNLLSQVLTDEGHSVETLDNATEALERIKGERYNLILVDIKMPGMSGIELYENIKKIARTLGRRMVFITGDVIAPDTRDFLTRTRVPCITKPFDIEQLKKDISRLLER